MITFRTKEDLNSSEEIDWYDNVELIENDNYIKQNIYLLHFDKCKFDGENDPTKPFLKLKTITRFNEIVSDMVTYFTYYVRFYRVETLSENK